MKASAGQKFCRACGFGLEKVEQLIAEQKPSATDQTTEAAGRFPGDWLRKLEKWVQRALLAMGSVAFSLIIWAIIVNVLIKEGGIFKGSMLLMLVIGVILLFLLLFLREARENSASTQSNKKQRLPQVEDTAKMLSEANLEVAASVTEQTTTRLGEKVITPIEKPQSS
jgi:hypothetical protein